MKLPVTLDGALMPDAHQGYGLPIGGVLATDNAIIPYGVGMDIGCRMALSVFDVPPRYLEQRRDELKKLLHNHTRFGNKEVFKNPADDPILHRPEFKEIPVVRGKREAAINQLGSSGSGNHFVEWGIVDITAEDNELNLPVGQYLGLLSHSGSRGLGAAIAQHYTKVAMQKCPLPPEARYLAWLDLDTQEGQEYWRAMNLAGDYASACHHDIHRRLSQALGEKPLAKVENHHNFAWKETLADGREAIVHRKGATPAGKGVLGVIPGSMTAPGFIVRGRGEQDSIQSASHGAGRRLSRTQAKQQVSEGELRRLLRDQGVELIGGGLDEAPMAYKDIHQVMAHQRDLVDVLGSFAPRIVRMDAGGGGKSKYGGE
ncbi:RtcB family protein [Hymenobacter weizhouensis]|nr:RtcB family protein [Hymenobacter sp. YIM 151500-1]